MGYDTLINLQDPAKYKNAVKEELGRVAAKPVKFQYYENFTFKDKKKGPILLVGEPGMKLIVPVTKSGAKCKAAGLCAINAETKKVEFAAAQGAVALNLLKAALVGTGKDGVVDSVKKLSVLAGEKEEKPEGNPIEAKIVRSRVQVRFDAVMKVFDTVKAKLDDEQRKKLRVDFGIAEEKMKKDDPKVITEAIQVLNKLEGKIKEELQANQKWSEEKKSGASQKLTAAKKSFDELSTEIQNIKKKLISLNVQSKKLNSAKPTSANQSNRVKVAKEIKELSESLPGKQDSLAKLLKSYEGEQEGFKEIQAMHDKIAKETKDLVDVAKKVGEEADPMKVAGDQISGTVKKMAEASKWQGENVKKAQQGKNMHGTGRHGAQTGFGKQARRPATGGVTADQPGNEAGVPLKIQEWDSIKIEYETGTDGKKKIKSRTEIEKHVVDRSTRYMATFTTSMFANPVLEKEAVDAALAIMAKDDWKDIWQGGNWRPLLSVAVNVPKPSTAPGYGYSMTKINQNRTMTTNATKIVIDKFEKGLLTIEQMLQQLDVRIKKDSTATGVKMIPHAKVVLVRDSNVSPWTPKTHFPDERITKAGWDIKGRKVRAGTKIVANLPDLA